MESVQKTPPPVFRLVEQAVLSPRGTWPEPAAYDAQAAKLAGMFRENFGQFESQVDAKVKEAGPR